MLATAVMAGCPSLRSLAPFCSACEEQCRSETLPPRLPGECAPALGISLARGDLWETLEALASPIEPTRRHAGSVQIRLHRCPSCDLTYVDLRSERVTRDGRRRWAWVGRRMQIAPTTADLLRATTGRDVVSSLHPDASKAVA